jgi:flagellar motor switch/type III secretory pathway protein FliN
MNTLERIARERCKWCAKGWRVCCKSRDGTWHQEKRGELHVRCTAPNPEVLIEELSQENAALKALLGTEVELTNEVGTIHMALETVLKHQELTRERLAQALRECRETAELTDWHNVVVIVDKALGPQS